MMTGVGVLLGTAAYMSPEQAKGRPAGKRSDIWAFGCVLYEMLTGRRAFEGDDVSDTLAAILRGEPDWRALPADTPAPVRRVLKRTLQKDPQLRLPHIGAARLDIDEARGDATTDDEREFASRGTARDHRRDWWRGAAWLVALSAAVIVVASLLAALLAGRRETTSPPIRLRADLGVDASFANTGTLAGAHAVLSPDGHTLAFVAQKSSGPTQLFIRRLDQLQPAAIGGTDFASDPFFSPDGQWVGFSVQNSLKKVPVTGGVSVTVVSFPDNRPVRGAWWAEDGSIVLAQITGALLRIGAEGGKPEEVTTLADGETTQRWPQVLPGGRSVLFTSGHGGAGASFDEANIVVQTLPNGPRRIVQRGAYYGRYAASGHLLYVQGSTLFAAPFDLARLDVTGPPVPVIEGVVINGLIGSAHFAVSPTGTLVYLSDRNIHTRVPMAWLGVDGKIAPLRIVPADWSNVSFSPDGSRLAMDVSDGKTTDIWVYEPARDIPTRLTFGPGNPERPVWTPDGKRIVFASTRDGALNLYWQRADGSGDAQRLTSSPSPEGAWSWHPSGKLLAFHELTPNNNDDVLILPIEGDETTGWKPGKPRPFLNGPYAERAPMFSPDGRWLAYQSTETGRDEVYVRPYPGPGGKWRVSTDGGQTPTWSRTKRELFYATLDQQLMVVSYTVDGDSFRADRARPVSDVRLIERPRTGPVRSFDLRPDGTRFALAPVDNTEPKQDKVVFVFNFFDELRRVAPARK
jgi:serine/threonine-protein kinase